MKPLLLLVLAMLVFSSTAKASSQTSVEVGKLPNTSDNPNTIFDSVPQVTDLLITFKALDAYENSYRTETGFKSFAQSEGGAWAYVTRRNSQETANLDVLNACQKYNLKYAAIFPCKLINVSGSWLDYPNRAREILDFLPVFVPEKPIDLRQLSNNASEDMQNKDYPMALAKRVWFHQHALEVDEHYFAVRLSFGLMAWAELGEVYPPAKTLLRYLANNAKSRLMNDPTHAYPLIHEYVATNRALERTEQSLSFFNWLDSYHPDVAVKHFHIFEDVLTEHEQFALYNKYIRPNVDFSQMVSTYAWSIDANKRGVYGDKEKSQEMLDFDTSTFIYNVSRLVAILVINGRSEEADSLVEKAQLELDSNAFITSLHNALDGALPKTR
jgi:hypothetical protein